MPSNCDFQPILNDIYEAIGQLGAPPDPPDLSGIQSQISDLQNRVGNLEGQAGSNASQIAALVASLAQVRGTAAQALGLAGTASQQAGQGLNTARQALERAYSASSAAGSAGSLAQAAASQARNNAGGLATLAGRLGGLLGRIGGIALAVAGLAGAVNSIRNSMDISALRNRLNSLTDRVNGLANRPGQRGPQGIPGPTGRPGERGLQGIPGSIGRPGVNGKPGERGLQGKPGERGLQGIPGPAGKPGVDGKPGPAGKPGVDGKPGPAGKPGVDGKPGPAGKPGVDGKPGPAGKPGPIGIPGLAGRPGERGLQGKPGERGLRGIPGPRGIPGQNGVSPPDLTRRVNDLLSRVNTAGAAIIGLQTVVRGLQGVVNEVKNRKMPTCNWSPAQISQVTGDTKKTLRLSTAIDLFLTGKLFKAVTKVGDDVVNLAKASGDFFKSSVLGRAWNALTLLIVLHNAAMLSRNIVDTLGDTLATGLELMGIKDEEGNRIDINQILGKRADDFMKSLLGETVWFNTKQSWVLANRALQAATNITSTLASIMDSSLEVGLWTAEQVAKIGNGLKADGVVERFRWPDMPETVPRGYSLLNKLEGLDDAASSVNMVVSELKSVQEEATDLVEQRDEFKKAVSDAQEGFDKLRESINEDSDPGDIAPI